VIGKEFSEAVLKRVVDLPEAELSAALTKLTASEFIYEQALYPDLEFTFKHALTQEVAYGLVLVERRQAIHERTAEAIETLFGTGLPEALTNGRPGTSGPGYRPLRSRTTPLSCVRLGPRSRRCRPGLVGTNALAFWLPQSSPEEE
jgi:hypothetical protein